MTISITLVVEEPEYMKAGEALLPAFESHNFFDKSGMLEHVRMSGSDRYISVEKIVSEFSNEPEHFREEDHEIENEMKQRLVCYLLGRTYPGPALQVLISSPIWLKPLCEGLLANPHEVNFLHLFFSEARVRMVESLQYITSLLEGSSYLRGLNISSSTVLVGYGTFIAQAIRTNKLNSLDIYHIASQGFDLERPDESDSQKIADALMVNTSIKCLGVHPSPSILKCFAVQDANDSFIKTLTLVFAGNSDSDNCFQSLKELLSTNQTLLRIYLHYAKFSQSMWMQIVDSMKTNTNLEVLDLGYSAGWIDRRVLSALRNLLRLHCTQIIDLGIRSPDTEVTYDVHLHEMLNEFLPSLKEQLRLNTEFGQALRAAPKGPPRSARVVLCGPGYAGKTTLCRTMLRKRRRWLGHKISMFLQKRPSLWRYLFGPDAEKELDERTRGVDMHVWKDQKDLRISLWDFAGQKEYYALHDYMFPNVNSANLFLFTFSLIPSPYESSEQDVGARIDAIKKELRFWLRFLCSNSKEFVVPKPRVRIVLTNIDRVTEPVQQWRYKIDGIVEEFKSFEDRVEVIPVDNQLLNAHSEEMVKEIEDKILEDFMGMIPKLEPTFTICEVVRKKLGELMNSDPVITVEEYDKICVEVDEKTLRSKPTRQAVASYLHNVGEIIYFVDLNFIVINPRWLGVGVLGNLLDVFGRWSTETKSKGVIGFFLRNGRTSKSSKIPLQDGFVKLEGLKSLLRESLQSVTGSTKIAPDDLIKLLLALEICYKDEDRGGYLIPAALDDEDESAARGCRQLHWRTLSGTRNYTYIGRRLQCADQNLTVLTPGFFPRLQVVLRKHLVEQKIIGGQVFDDFRIERNLLKFEHNGMSVNIEYGEGEHLRGPFVDVLVKTSLEFTETLDFMQEHVLTVIRTFCAQKEGNQGVTLVEGIINPQSVEHLVLCRHRENQSVLISELEDHLKIDIFYQFCYYAVPNDCPLAISLKLQQRQSYALAAIRGEKFAEEFIRKETSDHEEVKGAFEQMKEPISSMWRKLLREQVLPDTPKLVYVLEEKNFFLPLGKNEVRLRLHLQCEGLDGPHVVEQQGGRSFIVEDKLRQNLMKFVEWTYKMLKLGTAAVGKSLQGAGALEVLVNELPPRAPVLPSSFVSYPDLVKMGIQKKEEIVRFYEEMLMESSEWLISFLNIEKNLSKFESDFRLHKMRYRDTREIVFVCEKCKFTGMGTGMLRPP